MPLRLHDTGLTAGKKVILPIIGVFVVLILLGVLAKQSGVPASPLATARARTATSMRMNQIVEVPQGRRAMRVTQSPAPTPSPPGPRVVQVERLVPKAEKPDSVAHQAKMACPFAYTRWEQEMPPQVSEAMQKLVPMGPYFPRSRGTSEKKIPSTIVITHARDYIPMQLHKNIMWTVKQNSHADISYFSDRLARDFLGAHAHYTVLKAFDKAKPGRYKANIFKYQYLYTKGGWYIDSSLLMEDERTLYDLHRSEDELIATAEGSQIHGGLIGVMPKHPLMELALRTAVENVLSEKYGAAPNMVTGDGMLTTQFLTLTGKSEVSHGFQSDYAVIPIIRDPNCAVGKIIMNLDQGIVLGYTVFPEYSPQQAWYVPQTFNDAELWKERDAFFNSSTTTNSEKCFGGDSVVLEWNNTVTALAERTVQDILPHSLKTSTKRKGTWKLIDTTIVQMHVSGEVPKRMREAFERMTEENPKFSHAYYTHETASRYVHDNCDENAGKAFDMLNVGAFKSDIFRYCYLVTQGGVYIDADFFPLTNIASHLTNTSLLIAINDADQKVTPGFIAAAPKHPVLIKALSDAVQNVLHKKRGTAFDQITGAQVLSDALLTIISEEDSSLTKIASFSAYNVAQSSYNDRLPPIRTVRWNRESECATGTIETLREQHSTSKDTLLFLTQYRGYFEDMSWYLHRELHRVHKPKVQIFTPQQAWEKRRVYRKKKATAPPKEE